MGDEARISITREEFGELLGFEVPEWQWDWLVNNRQYPISRFVGLSNPRVNGRSRGIGVTVFDDESAPRSQHPLEYFAWVDEVEDWPDKDLQDIFPDVSKPIIELPDNWRDYLKPGVILNLPKQFESVQFEFDQLRHTSPLSGRQVGRRRHLEDHLESGDVVCRCGEPAEVSEKRTDAERHLEPYVEYTEYIKALLGMPERNVPHPSPVQSNTSDGFCRHTSNPCATVRGCHNELCIFRGE